MFHFILLSCIINYFAILLHVERALDDLLPTINHSTVALCCSLVLRYVMLSPGVKLCRDVVSQFCRLRCHRTLVLNLQCPPSSIVLRRVSTPTGEGKGLFEKVV